MTATHEQNSTAPTIPVLSFSLELGSKNWRLAFTIGLDQKPRHRTIAARDTDALLAEGELVPPSSDRAGFSYPLSRLWKEWGFFLSLKHTLRDCATKQPPSCRESCNRRSILSYSP